MEGRSWKLFILCGLLSGPLRVKSSVDLLGSQTNQEAVHSIDKKRQELIPYPRMGRSSSSKSEDLSPLEVLQKKFAEKHKENQRYFSVHKEQEKNNDVGDIEPEYDVSQYLLPYPRPGRYLNPNDLDATFYDQENLPYPRFGKSYGSHNEHRNLYNLPKKNEKPDDLDTLGQFLTPYPRIGKRNQDNLLNQKFRNDDDKSNEFMISYLKLNSSDEFMIPYPRFGRNDDFLTPYPRFGRSDEFITPYPRLGRSDEFITPYPRLGRSEEYITPYPRLGRSEEYITPYPRLGRSEEYLTPYPRLGRSEEYITPYPRLGRSEEYITPYPRLGRSQKAPQFSLLDNGLDQDSLKFKNPLLTPLNDQKQHNFQYLRVERSENNKKKRNATNSNEYEEEDNEDDEDGTITMIPTFRFGRSSSKDLQIRKKRNSGSEILLPYPRLGRNLNIFKDRDTQDEDTSHRLFQLANKVSYFRSRRDDELKNKAHKTMKQNGDKEISYSEYYMLPYPRPGRNS